MRKHETRGGEEKVMVAMLLCAALTCAAIYWLLFGEQPAPIVATWDYLVPKK